MRGTKGRVEQRERAPAVQRAVPRLLEPVHSRGTPKVALVLNDEM